MWCFASVRFRPEADLRPFLKILTTSQRKIFTQYTNQVYFFEINQTTYWIC